ncbi:MAG: hypothetical protein ACREN0_08900, partial [Thermodesulfobacteriota bacterium]
MDLSEVLKSTLLIGPEISLIVAGIVLMILDPITKGEVKKNLFWIALAGLTVGFILNLKRFSGDMSAFSGALSLDQFAAYFNVIFLLGAAVAVVFSKDYLTGFI